MTRARLMRAVHETNPLIVVHLRVKPSIKEDLRIRAQEQGVTMNRLASRLLAYGLEILRDEDYIKPSSQAV